MGIEITHITQANRHLLGRLAIEVFDHAIQDQFLNRYLADPQHAMFIAFVDDPASDDHLLVVGQARGIVHFHPDQKPEFYVENLGVTPAYQRKGIATRLMDALVDWGEAQGTDYTWLGTEADNGGAIAFYKQYGLRATAMVMFDDEDDGVEA